MDANNSNITPILPAESIDGTAAASIAAAATAYAQFALQAAALVPGQDGQLVLPAGVSLDNIRVVGRDLVIRMPDGSEVVVPDGAVFVPQFVVDGVAVPPVNLAALLIGQEPQPAAGPPQSSGGNFSQVPGDIGDPFGLGDLLPPTELAFPEPEQRELVPGLIDRDPDVNIQDGGPAGKDVTDNVSEVGLPGTRTNGNVESPGSSAGNGSDSTTGTIIVTSPDGIASITINGVVYTGEGQQITTPNGVLTLGALTGDQIPYTYRLTDNTSGNNTTDVFTVVLTDPDGDSSTARLTIVIADDVPTARNDTDSVAGGTYGPETGNVLSGAGTTSGSAGADTLGADGGAISGFRAGSSGSFAAVGTTINGQYGTLTLGANGTYTYVRNTNTPGGVTDVFTYQLTDSDGDASTATLTINIGDAPNRIVFVPEIGEGTQVREPHLPARDGEPSGSQFDGNPESTSGTITFNSPDGVGSVTISGVTITPGALPQQVVSDATGTLVITAYSYDPVTGNGSITYTYTLNDNTLNTSGSTVTFPIVVTDLDGDSANDDLNITIIDDAPLAVNDSATQETENAPVTVNVFTNDTPGADSVNLSTGVTIVSESLSGAGSLAYNGDGTFTYTPAPGEEGTVTFQYTITDGDGDPSTATVTITLLKDSQPRVDVSGENFVDEAGLPARGSEPEGSNESSDSENTTGTIAISTGGDTLQSLVINGTNVTAGGTVTGAHGTLTVTVSEGAYSYSYTLTDNTSGEGATDSFNVVVTDSDGDSANDTLVIGIHDDAPTAIKDADNIAAGEYGPATGNVITDAEGDGGADTPGADGVTVTAISGFGGAGAVDGTTNGQYGVLTLNADGSYSYARNPGTPGGVSDVFSYTITDGDGDPSTATLTISIDDSKTTLDLPTEGEAGTQVEEAGLPAGSDAGADSELTAGTIAYTAPDGPATVTIDGVAVTAVGQTFTGSFGTLTITSIAPGAIGYEYELTTNTSGDATFDDFAVVVTDQDGDNTPGTLVIDIVDDVPTAREDIDSVTEDAFVDGEGNPQADGNVLTGVGGFDANATDGVGDTEGADGAVVTAVAFDPNTGVDGDEVAGVVNGDTPGEYGSLALNADGSYTYTLNNFDPRVQGLDSNDTLTESFIYTITDGDGDPSTTTLTITINGSDDRITINGLNVEGPDLIVDEDDLPVRDLEPAGSDTTPESLTQTGSFTVNGLDGIASVKIGGTEAFVGQTIPSAYGTFTITSISAPADGNATAITIGYSYVLTDNTAHANAGGENFLTELFDVAVTDTDGSTDTDQVEVRIVDDVPTAKPDGTYSVAEQTALTFDALANDVKGADGVNLVTGVAIATNPSKGTVVYNDDGTFTYTPNAGAEGADSFTYTITDGDGDPSTTTVTLNLLADSIPEIARVTNLTVDEDGFAGANADNGLPGEVTSTNSTSATGTLVASFGADVPTNLLASISLNDSAALDGQLVTLAGLPVTFAKVGNDLVGSADGQEIIRISITGAVAGPGASDVTYTYTATLLQPVQHAVPGSEDSDILSAIGFTVTDSEGDPASGSFAVTVVDDLPTLEIGGATASVTEGGAPYNGVWTLDPGADGMTTLSLNVNGTVQSFTLGGAPATFALAQG
ncbi:MAG: tandem-95 repeat protein, partial [Sphingorhabdus sp.]|uniref:beta strand repeat-containing protein n=1 Tax=Sphingorhabdus sp. TaxID=1902408 RepID=UPI003C98F0CA